MQTPASPPSAAPFPPLPSPHFTQESRLLRLTTPLGPDVLLAECVRGEEGLSELFRFKIAALSTDAALPLRGLIGQPVLLELLTSHSRDELRPFHGHVTALEMTGANGGFARYHLTVEPWTAFLGHGRDSRIFQDRSVIDIIDSVLGAYRGKGMLAPAWRFDLLDPDLYTRRSTLTQYQESDLAFIQRLMHEEGLFYYFEHAGDAGQAPFGSHTLVIADHNGSFVPNRQATIAFTQPGATMREDSLDRWRTELRAQTDAVELLSWDYRSLDVRTVSAAGAGGGALVSRDTPGAYAYTSRAHGQRIADRQMQALEAAKEVHVGAGTVRTLAPGTTFTLNGHPRLDDAGDDDARGFLVTRTVHLMHNNLSAELSATLAQHLGRGALEALIAGEQATSLHAVGKAAGQRPLYRVRIDAIRSKVAYRSSGIDAHGQLLHPRPSVRGQQTAIVVGPPGVTVHTDRDHRIKVQFHWQRGSQGHNRLTHPAPDGHADDRAGTWVRVATPMAPVAGTNWGSNALPRVGQEVLVDFLEGNIDRPVVIGALYNGRGQPDAQHNQVSAGAGAASGNAPTWFPGQTGAHAHPAVLSGIKTQALGATDGGGAYSQLVFDDSPGQARVALQRHAQAHGGTAELNLGHLQHQSDNARLPASGFGAELKTEHSAALRAGSGLLLSTDARGSAAGNQMDSREASDQVRQSAEMQTALTELAHKHNSRLDNEPASEQLPAIRQLKRIDQVLGGEPRSFTAASNLKMHGDDTSRFGGYVEPHLQLSGRDGIAVVTPSTAILSATTNTNLAADQAINFAAQGSSYHAVATGIGIFTYGKIDAPEKPNREIGIAMHAASGIVSVRSQSDVTKITADKTVTVASITKSVVVGGKKHIMLNSQGATLRLEGGDITLSGPGKMEFKASMKELSGPLSVPSTDIASRLNELEIKGDLEIEYVDADGNLLSDEPIEIILQNGKSLDLTLDAKGTAVAKNIPLGPLSARQPRRK